MEWLLSSFFAQHVPRNSQLIPQSLRNNAVMHIPRIKETGNGKCQVRRTLDNWKNVRANKVNRSVISIAHFQGALSWKFSHYSSDMRLMSRRYSTASLQFTSINFTPRMMFFLTLKFPAIRHYENLYLTHSHFVTYSLSFFYFFLFNASNISMHIFTRIWTVYIQIERPGNENLLSFCDFPCVLFYS